MEENISKLITEIKLQINKYDSDHIYFLDTLERVVTFKSDNPYILNYDTALKKNLDKLQILFEINEIKKEIKHPPNELNDKCTLGEVLF
jgi:hypothetical protein